MSRKTEPRGITPSKKGSCPECGGTGVTGMYQERCNSCDGTGLSQTEVSDLVVKSAEATTKPLESAPATPEPIDYNAEISNHLYAIWSAEDMERGEFEFRCREIQHHQEALLDSARKEPVGDAIEINVPPKTMKYVMDKIKLKNKTIAKRTLTPEWVVDLWAKGKGDKYDNQVYIWKLKILASLTGYNWAIFLLEPKNLPLSKSKEGGV